MGTDFYPHNPRNHGFISYLTIQKTFPEGEGS